MSGLSVLPGVALAGSFDAPDILKAWLVARSPDTLKSYQAQVSKFAKWCGVKDSPAAVALLLTRTHGEANAMVFRFRNDLAAAGAAPATINLGLAALASLTKVARILGYIPWVLEVPRMKGDEYRDTRGPGRKAVHQLFARSEERGDAKGLRDLAILKLLYERALRIKEVLEMKVEHVDAEGSRLSILGKGRRAREWVTCAPSTMEAIANWLEVRGTEPGPLFSRLSRYGTMQNALKPLSRMGGYRIVRHLGESIGVRARPHGLRHSAITDALDAGADIRAVQRFSRHRNIQTVLTYDDNRRDMGGEVSRLISATPVEARPEGNRAVVALPVAARMVGVTLRSLTTQLADRECNARISVLNGVKMIALRKVTSIRDHLEGRKPRLVWTYVQPPPELRCA